MATPMRSTGSQQDAGHRARVADSRQATTAASTNFEYDDNEWDIGIGDLIIDLDADIEKTNEGANSNTTTTNTAIQNATGGGATTACPGGGGGSGSTSGGPVTATAPNPTGHHMATNASPNTSAKAAAKMAIEHSAIVDKGLKMKIKRTKPGTKTSEAKHEIVKSNEQNGNVEGTEVVTSSNKGTSGGGNTTGSGGGGSGKHPQTVANAGATSAGAVSATSASQNASTNSSGGSGNSKRSSGGHRRDKTRDKHSDKPGPKVTPGSVPVTVSEVNGMVRVSAPQPGPQRPVFPASTGPGPPTQQQTGPSPGPPPSPAAATAQGSAAKPEQAKIGGSGSARQPTPPSSDDRSSSPPPSKKLKTDPKEVTDVCVGTSVGTITEPDCLGPCEPGTSVTLEGIVWHETEGGVLVVNVTWRGKTYVGTLLDCTRHDWAPPRFCDSPTSDLDTRTPKGRGKRGRSAASTTPTTDLSNFTETRSSVHSKLRNGGGGTGGAVKGRRGAAASTNGSTPSTAPSSPTPFIPPRVEPSNKRKSRAGEEEPPVPGNKKTKVAPAPTPAAPCGSPPPSPVLLECPEPNCSKKYKHINGLKYHQSHAHGSADDEDTKDVTSMSENDESSNIEAPSPATPVKSPDKSQDSPSTPQKKEDLPLMLRNSGILDVSSQPATPRSTPPSPATPQSIQDLTNSAGSPTAPLVETSAKNVIVKPGVLRYTSPEEFPVTFPSSKPQQVTGATLPISGPLSSTRPVNVSSIASEQQLNQVPEISPPPPTFGGQLQQQQTMPSQTFTQPPTLLIPAQNPVNNQPPSQPSPHPPQSPKPVSNMTPFKVKPTASLMPDDKKALKPIPTNFKKKSRKSPASSPDPPQTNEQPVFGMEQPGSRDEVQSPAYSDISDDGAPVLESDTDKNKMIDKKTEQGQQMSQHMSQYYYYSQPPYMVSSVQDGKSKEAEKQPEKSIEKEPKKDTPEYQQKVLPQHYYPYGYMPSYPYNVEPSYGQVPVIPDEKIKEEIVKDNPSPIEQNVKQNAPIPNPIQVPNPGKVKTEPAKEKHQSENHQMLKESIEMKNQMSYNVYSRQQQHQAQREEDVRRYFVYQDRRKEQHQAQQQQQQQQQQSEKNMQLNKVPSQSPNLKHKDKSEDKKDKDIKQEGVKPTMETQGPPPPPTSQYTYIHPSYMQSPHYGALHFDPNHPVYRGLMVPGPYSSNPYLHPQIPRYHAPEDLSRAPPPTKALDMLQHHAQYYSTHKIHELQERAIKSPTPKTSVASSSPSANSGVQNNQQLGVQQPPGVPPVSQPNNTTPISGGKQTSNENKESRSPPPQRHVHTHHHTHVGLGYPMYPAPYGAAVLASQQAAAVTVINPYPPK